MRGGYILDYIRIQNVRSLKDTGKISLPQITILVGENSSGKSTFLRTFPLIKQSITKRTDGPILWAGDVDDYVDFGSFSETVTNDSSNALTFSFGFPFSYLPSNFAHDIIPINFNFEKGSDAIEYTIKIESDQSKSREYVSYLSVSFNNTIVDFNFTKSQSNNKDTASITINNETISIPKMKSEGKPVFFWDYDRPSNIFGFSLPSISGIRDEIIQVMCKDENLTEEQPYNRVDDFLSILTATIIGNALIHDIALNDLLSDKVQIAKDEVAIDSAIDFFRDSIKKILHMSKSEQHKLCVYCELLFFYECFPQIDQYLDRYFRQVHYIAPLRATAERYYRLRNLAIDDVDYQGKNLAVFINGLSKQRLSNFQEWTTEQFGFKVETERGGGHLSVKISLAGNEKRINLSDTGFGYSQILPIITQLWDLSTRKRKKTDITIPLIVAIEQPELHLHPAIQAKLVEAFIAAIKLAKQNNYQLQLLLETHSETIINRFGQSILKKEIDANDVEVVLFERSLDSMQTNVKISKYDSDGFLTNWPVGFFAPQG